MDYTERIINQANSNNSAGQTALQGYKVISKTRLIIGIVFMILAVIFLIGLAGLLVYIKNPVMAVFPGIFILGVLIAIYYSFKQLKVLGEGNAGESIGESGIRIDAAYQDIGFSSGILFGIFFMFFSAAIFSVIIYFVHQKGGSLTLPIMIMSIFLLFGLLVIYLSYRGKKILNANPTPMQQGGVEDKNEKVVCPIYGISKTVRFSGLSGGTFNPENAIFITNKRILLVAIPYEGYKLENVAGPGSWMLRDKLAEKGNQMIKTMNPGRIFSSDTSNKQILFSDIQKIEFKKGFLGGKKIKIYTSSGKKFSYFIYIEEDFTKLQQVLSKFTQ